MTSTLEEQLGVAGSATYWDVGDFRLWQSTVDGIIVYVPISLRLAKETSGRYHASLTQVQRWHEGIYEVTGGTAIFGLFGDVSAADEEAHKREEQWTRVVLNMGYRGTGRPRFVPLPVRDIRLTGIVDASQAHVVEGAANNVESRTLVLDLTATGAREWGRAIREKSPVPGSVRFSYVYPQMMPSATAKVTIHWPRVYIGLSAILNKAADGTLYGSADDIRTAWVSLIRAGAVEILLTEPTPATPTTSQAELFTRLSEQAREQLFGVMFAPYVSQPLSTGSFYALRRRSTADAVDFSIMITVEGWVWLSASLEAELSIMLSALDGSYIQTSYESVSVPVSLVVEPSPMAATVATSLNFSEGRAPEAPLFDGTGGTRQFLIATGHPDTVRVSYHVQINFKPSNWPIIETSGTASLANDGYKIVVRPESWVRRHTLYMYVRSGNRIVAAGEADSTDYLTVTATYQAPYLAAPIRAASRITPQGPIEFSYPVPPGVQAGRATLSAIGMVGGQLVQASALDIQETEDAVYILVDGNRIQIVGRNAVVNESDPLVARLQSANARPVVSKAAAPIAEDERDIDVSVDISLIPQPTDVSCWAASLAMVISDRDQSSFDPLTIAMQAGMDVDIGYGWSDIQRAVIAWNLIEEWPQCAVPAEWARLLKQWGPIWVVEVGAPYHAVVLGGIRGDGTPEGTQVTIYNPWPPGVGAVETKTFLDFDTEFGLGAGADAAMVHAMD